MGCKTTHCNSTLVSKSDVVVLAVKPNVVAKVLDELRTSLVEDTSKKILVSIAAGIGLTQLQGRAYPAHSNHFSHPLGQSFSKNELQCCLFNVTRILQRK